MSDKSIALNPDLRGFGLYLDPQTGVSLATMKSVGSKYGLTLAAFRQYCALSSKAGMKCSADARYDWVRFAVGSGIAPSGSGYWVELANYASGAEKAAKLTGAAKPGGVSRADAAKKVSGAGDVKVPTVCMYATITELRAAAKVLGVSIPKGSKKDEICAYLVASVGESKVKSTLRAQMIASGRAESLKTLAALKELGEDSVDSSSLALFKGLKEKADPAAAAATKAAALATDAETSIEELKKMGGGGGGGGGARKPRRKAKSGYKKRGGARGAKYQDSQGRWRYGSGKKKGKYAPAPRS